MVLFITIILPVGTTSSLPATYLELIAAGRKPVLYRVTIAFDVTAWLTLGGFLIALAALFVRRAPIRGTFIGALGVSALVGFFGACVRLAGTTDLADRYLEATTSQRTSLLESYVDLQRLVNISFSAGGLATSIALVLAASVAWRRSDFARWTTGLIALDGVLGISKGAIELATGADLGPLGLLGGISLIISLFGITTKFSRRAKATTSLHSRPQ
jgi:hypothetical protein